MGLVLLLPWALDPYRTAERPWVLGGLCILWGYLAAWLGRRPRYGDAAFRRHLHRWQLRELVGRFVRRPAGGVA